MLYDNVYSENVARLSFILKEKVFESKVFERKVFEINVSIFDNSSYRSHRSTITLVLAIEVYTIVV